MYWSLRKCRLINLVLIAMGLLALLIVVRRTSVHFASPSVVLPRQKNQVASTTPLLSSKGEKARNRGEPKLILLWNSFADLHLEDGSGMFHQFHCAQTRCSITRDRSLLADSSVVLFHMRETVSPQQLPDRNERPPGQKWIFAMKEPPVYSHFDASIFNGLFDWTMTYQSNSTILWPYGGIARRPKPRLLPDYFAKKFANSVTIANVKNYTQEPNSLKNRSISWIVSRCKSDTKREDFVADLQKYIDVAIYGRCGPLQCSRGNGSDSCQDVIKDYHFYLAFENSFCPDYVTEKLYKILAIDDRPPIPIVMGRANYALVAPPGSVIDVRDFASTQELALFLEKVMSDKELYNSFHQWRRDFRVLVWGTPKALCTLCSKTHEISHRDDFPQPDLEAFWDKRACRG